MPRTLDALCTANSCDARSQSFRGRQSVAEERAHLVLVGDLITSYADSLYMPDICSHACQSMGLVLKFLPEITTKCLKNKGLYALANTLIGQLS